MLKPCRTPKALGMESGKIPDNAITASSFYYTWSRPSNGRLNKHIGRCAWIPTTKGKSNSWFQVDLGQMATVTGIATQGSCYHRESFWTKSYSVSYSTDGTKWTYYQESGYKKVSSCVNLLIEKQARSAYNFSTISTYFIS